MASEPHNPELSPAQQHGGNVGERLVHGDMRVKIDPDQYDGLTVQRAAIRGLGDPTLLGLFGYLIPFQTASFCLLGLHGADISSLTAISGSFYFFGGLVSLIAGALELVLGRSFVGALFIAYGAHWLQTGYQYDPVHGLAHSYATATDPTGAFSEGYLSGSALYNVSMCMMSCVFFVGSLKTTAPLALALFSLIPLFGLLAGGEFYIASHPDQLAHGLYLIKIAGGFGLATSFCGWYMAFRATCLATGLPWTPPEFSLISTKPSSNAGNERPGVLGES